MSLIGQTADSDQVKTCSKCGEEKSLDAFVKNKGGKFGVHSKCRVCTAAYQKARNKDPEVRAKQREYLRSYNSDPINRERKREHDRALSKRQPDKYAAKTALRRARTRNQTPELTAEEQQRIQDIYWLAKDLRAVTGEEYHVDHIIPLAKGGLHHPDNLQVLPADLNLKKGAKV